MISEEQKLVLKKLEETTIRVDKRVKKDSRRSEKFIKELEERIER